MVDGDFVPLNILVEEEAMKTKLQAEQKPALKNKERESKEIKASIRQHQLSLDRYLVKGAKWLAIPAIASSYFSWTICYILIGLITFFLTLKSLNDQYNWEEKLEDYKMFRKAKFMLNMRKLGKQAKSLNQT
jgi:hypothetical protein